LNSPNFSMIFGVIFDEFRSWENGGEEEESGQFKRREDESRINDSQLSLLSKLRKGHFSNF